VSSLVVVFRLNTVFILSKADCASGKTRRVFFFGILESEGNVDDAVLLEETVDVEVDVLEGVGSELEPHVVGRHVNGELSVLEVHGVVLFENSVKQLRNIEISEFRKRDLNIGEGSELAGADLEFDVDFLGGVFKRGDRLRFLEVVSLGEV